MAIELPPDPPSLSSKIRSFLSFFMTLPHLLFCLRFVQVGSATLTGYIYCFLVWQHNNHYCAWFPSDCTPSERALVHVPREYIIVLTSLTLIYLETYYSAFATLYRHIQTPTTTTTDLYKHHLRTSTPVALFAAFSLSAILRNHKLSGFCWFLAVPTSIKADVERKYCVSVVNGYAALGVVVGFSWFVVILCGVVTGRRAFLARREKERQAASAAVPALTAVVNEKV